MLNEETEEQSNNRPWLYKKGQSGNPGGRPKGSISMKTWIQNKLATMTETEREEYLEGVDKAVIWKMAEGNPESTSKTDITTMGEKLPSTDLDALAEVMANKLKEEKI